MLAGSFVGKRSMYEFDYFHSVGQPVPASNCSGQAQPQMGSVLFQIDVFGRKAIDASQVSADCCILDPPVLVYCLPFLAGVCSTVDLVECWKTALR